MLFPISSLPMAKKQAASAPAITAEQLTLIQERNAILLWLATAKNREKDIRTKLAKEFFPTPAEGVNRLVTADGYAIAYDFKINRKLDESALDTVMMELPEGCNARVPGVLIAYRPTLVLAGYRELPADQLKIVQQVVTESDGLGELDIVAPAIVAGEAVVSGSDAASTQAEAIAAGKKLRRKTPLATSKPKAGKKKK